MKRLVILTIIKMCGEAILLTLIAGILIGVIGYINKWDTSLAYSDAFFIAGCLAIAGGGLSRLSVGHEWKQYLLLPAESLHGMSSSEQANFIIYNFLQHSNDPVIFGALFVPVCNTQ